MPPVTPQDLRKAGFAADADKLPRDEIALRLLCAFNGVDGSAPPGWWFHPNASSQKAWGRVATEAERIFCGQTFTWTDRNGTVSRLTVGDHDTPDAALKSATGLGWTPPKWWQWWRWGDQPRKDTPT